MWDEVPFKKSTIGPMVFGALFGGVGLVWGCKYTYLSSHAKPFIPLSNFTLSCTTIQSMRSSK